MDIKKYLGMAVRTLRDDRGWSQAELAKRAKMPQSRISEFERGMHVGVERLAQLSQAFEVQPHEVMQLAEELEKEDKESERRYAA